MKILVYPHDLGIGGSQLNAVELAAAVRDLGHEVVVFGRRGALNARIDALGLEFVEAPPPGRRPSVTTARALRRLVAERGIDVVHGYEWPPVLDALLACRGRRGPAVIATVMSMSVPPFIPRSTPLIVGTEEIAAAERAARADAVSVIEPPVDLAHNRREATPGVTRFAREHGLDDGRTNVVAVARFARELKLEGTLTAIDTVAELAERFAVRLVLVGDGPAREEIEARASAANARKPGTVVLTGQLDDPRPAYAAADVALGMGGSALRALAFGAPLVVQGEQGFWRRLEPSSVEQFLWTGWYGVGDGSRAGGAALERELAPLLADAGLRRQLGEFGLDLVTTRFSLARAARLQEAAYRRAIGEPGAPARAQLAALARYARYYAGRRLARFAGRASEDDFNARPVTATRAESSRPRPVLWLAGVGWQGTSSTEARLLESLAERRPVAWLAPPARGGWRGWVGLREPAVTRDGGLTRVRVPALPGVTRWPISLVSGAVLRLTLVRLRRSGGASAIVSASPIARLPRRSDAPRGLFVTDDWVAGAALMGLSERRIARTLRRNADRADAIAAVSEPLLETVLNYRDERLPAPRTRVIPNGAPPPGQTGADARGDAAVLVGQINERTDIALIERVLDAGVRVRIIGPRADRDPEFGRRLDRLLARAGGEDARLEWIPGVAPQALPPLIAACQVGLTPYTDTAFNRASSPLKTLDYLAAGIPVVSTDLPASRALGTAAVRVAADADEFVALVIAAVGAPGGPALGEECRRAAAEHGWDHRARALAELLGIRDDAEAIGSARPRQRSETTA